MDGVSIGGAFGTFFMFFIGGVLISLPLFLLCQIIFLFFLQKKKSPLFIKIALNGLAIIGLFSISYFGIDSNDFLYLMLIYSPAIIIASLCVRIRKHANQINSQ